MRLTFKPGKIKCGTFGVKGIAAVIKKRMGARKEIPRTGGSHREEGSLR